MKISYISPPSGLLDITVIRDKDPRVEITLDLGIPNFTVFSLKMPVVQDRPADMSGLLAEALSALLDEMSAFMLSLNFQEEVIVRVYATVLATFKEMTPESATDAGMSSIGEDNTVVTYEGSFLLDQGFVDETYSKVVTGSQIVKRVPKVRHVELTVLKPTKVDTQDVGKIIRQYRNRSLKTQPKPMFVVVYDQRGRPTGTIPIGNNMKNTLLKMRGATATPQFTDTVKIDSETELKIKNAIGIPESIYIRGYAGGQVYSPQAFCGDDMALYTDGMRFLVKFPDGRMVKFPTRPSIKQLKEKNYPVPAAYWRWTLIKKEKEPAQSEEAADEMVKCKRCGKDTNALAVFPGGICLDCYAAKEGKQPLTNSGFENMVNTFKGR